MEINMISNLFMAVQFFFTVIIGIYFLGQLRGQRSDKEGINEDSKHVMERLNEMRRISLTEPLTEQTRPSNLSEIIGQQEGVEALKVALCGKNPQHVLIYGPPGVGKTAASRVVMEYAKLSEGTPFKRDAKFVEVDATIMQYDERSIADPLIGSVHDPIYQGAGAYGAAGVPQPKEGAVSKAHGGILFIDEIGELQPIQMNRLLKVLEDRKVKFESAYYSTGNKNIPRHIHDVFKNGIPADFRLIGATTRSPEEIPPAIRSRCTEIFFNSLKKEDILQIIDNTLSKLGIEVDNDCKNFICKYCSNGRDTVMLLQTLASKLNLDKRTKALKSDIEWVIDSGHYNRNYDYHINDGYSIGKVNGLAVTGSGSGIVIPIEVYSEKCDKKHEGNLKCGGITENETIERGRQTFSRTSTAKTSVENVMTALKSVCGIETENYNIHINIPGGMPVDGPSAGIAIFVCCYSAILGKKVPNKIAFTGEISIKGEVLPVGGVEAKIEAAENAGADTVIIPESNNSERFMDKKINVVAVSNISEILNCIFERVEGKSSYEYVAAQSELASAKEE